MRLITCLFLLALTARVAASAPEPSRFYAAVGMTKAQKNSSIPTDSGLYVRQADGTWTHFGPRILGIASLAAQPGNPDLLLLASADGVIRSTDGGRTWRKTTGWQVADVRSVAFDPSEPRQVYAASHWGPLRSEDGGATWSLAQEGLPELFTPTVIVDRAKPGRVMLGTAVGVYESRDRGRSWRRTASPETPVLRLVQSPADARLMVAGTEHRGVWVSRNAGKSWTQTDPATQQANVYAVALHPGNAAVLAVGGWAIGARVSTDGGATWQDRTAGLPVKAVFVLAFDPDVEGRLWASTFEEGTFFSDDLGATWKSGGLYGAYGSDFVFVPATQR